jgi:hypothetical protein
VSHFPGPARASGIRQIHVLTTSADLPAGEVRRSMSSRWREENYFRYARTRFALDIYAAALATRAARCPTRPETVAAIPAQIRLGALAPDMVRLDAEVEQITHAIRMAAYNAKTTPSESWTATTPASAMRPTR